MQKKLFIVLMGLCLLAVAQKPKQLKANTKYLFIDDSNNKITCKVQALCDITLLTGDVFQSWIFTRGDSWADSARLKTQYVDTEGNQHVILQATAPDKNNYVILVGADTQYKFYLEANATNTTNNYVFIQRTTNNFNSSNSVIDNGVAVDFDSKTIDKKYKYSGDLSAHFMPKQVFNDGKKTYIELPDSVEVSDLPDVYTNDSMNNIIMLNNARYRKPFFIVDAVLDRYILISGSPDSQESLKIEIIRVGSKSKSHLWDRVFGVKQ